MENQQTPTELSPDDDYTADCFVAALLAVAHAEEKGLKKGNGGLGSFPCQRCKTGTVNYGVAGYNGHMQGKCTTPGCVRWIQ